MTLMRMPVFVWMMLVVAFLTAVRDADHHRRADHGVHRTATSARTFFQPNYGGDPLLYQHLFWLFGHPEVYILILPGHGHRLRDRSPCSRASRCSGTRSSCSRASRSASSAGACGRTTCSPPGLGPVAISAFGLSTMLIAIPTGVKIFNWLGHGVEGIGAAHDRRCSSRSASSRCSPSAGSRACSHSIVPADTQQTDTYFVVAHFHYVLFGGLMFAMFGGFYYWCPKVFGRMLDERLGKMNFWTDAHRVQPDVLPDAPRSASGACRAAPTATTPASGWDGDQPARDDRRVHHRPVGARVPRQRHRLDRVEARRGRRRRPVGRPHARVVDPVAAARVQLRRDARGPGRDDFWHRKYTEDDEGQLLPLPSGGAVRRGRRPSANGHGIHMPSPSIYPLVAGRSGSCPSGTPRCSRASSLSSSACSCSCSASTPGRIEPGTEEA